MTQTTEQPTYSSTNPATGEVTAEFDVATDDAIETGLAAGAAAFLTWRALPIQERAALATRVGDLFAERADELARIAVEEMGKPLGEAVEEVEFCQAIFGYYGKHGEALAADQPIETFTGDQAVVQKRPIGLLLGVMPWNFPYYQVARFAAPNMVLGNIMLLKHAESVPRCAEAIQQIFDGRGSAGGGLSERLRHLRPGRDDHRRPTRPGRRRSPGPSGPARRSRRSPVSTSRSASSSSAARTPTSSSTPTTSTGGDQQAWETRIYNTGQACNSNKRMIVMDDLYEPFVGELVDLARGLKPGDPSNPSDDTFAPMSSRAALDRLKERRGRRGGPGCPAARRWRDRRRARGLLRTRRAHRRDARRCGPTARSCSARSPSSTRSPPTTRRVELANDTPYGLGGAVFSTDPTARARLAMRSSTSGWPTSTPPPARVPRSRSAA